MFSKLVSKVSNFIESEKALLEQEDEKLKAQTRHEHESDTHRRPWDDVDTTDAALKKTIRGQILALSVERAAFFEPVPAAFEFDIETMLPRALGALDSDKNLSNMRFRLVPTHLSDNEFFRAYFFQIERLKLNFGLPSSLSAPCQGAAAETDAQAEPPATPTTSVASTTTATAVAPEPPHATGASLDAAPDDDDVFRESARAATASLHAAPTAEQDVATLLVAAGIDAGAPPDADAGDAADDDWEKALELELADK